MTTLAAADVVIAAEQEVAASRRSRMRGVWILLTLTAGAIAITLISRHLIYPAFSWNRDEATYLWQTDLLRLGKVFSQVGKPPQFFWPWLAGVRGDGFFSQYTVGWPVVLLVAKVVFGSADVALSVGTVLAVLGTYLFTKELTRDASLALLAACVMLLSPIVLIQSGAYLPYLFTMGMGLLFGAALLAGVRRRSWLTVGAAGVILGWVLLARPYDAVLWALPIGSYVVFTYRRQSSLLLRTAVWAGVALAPFVAFTLFYNRHVTGSFTRFPITAKEPLDTFGFGPRKLMPIAKVFHYSVSAAVHSTAKNLRELPPFLFGGFLGLLVAWVGLLLRVRDRTTLALVGLIVAFPVGYFFFWGNLLSRRYAWISGPLYIIPIYAPLCILLGAAVLAAWKWRRGVAVALGLALIGATVPVLVAKIGPNHAISAAQEPWKTATLSIHEDAVVIVENSGDYLMHLNPYSRNSGDLDGRILYAVDRGAQNLDLIAAHPGRRPYLENTSDTGWDFPVSHYKAPVPKISLIPLRVVKGTTVRLRARITNPQDAPVIVATLRVGAHSETRVVTTSAVPGAASETAWSVSSTAAPDVTQLTRSHGDVVITVGTGQSVDQASSGRQQIVLFAYRLDGSTVELLNPSRKFVGKFVNGRLKKARERLRLTGVDVAADSAP